MKEEFVFAEIRKVVEAYVKGKITGSITIHFKQGGGIKIETKQIKE